MRAISGIDAQRLGLSATVGAPESLLEWFCIGSSRESEVIAPGQGAATDADVQIDYVGSVENAVYVISRLHKGEKRLAFTDSRSQAEELATALRTAGVETFVSHSSLSPDERRQAERAFREARDCVIVATSTLELGIDVGDLDRGYTTERPPIGSCGNRFAPLGRVSSFAVHSSRRYLVRQTSPNIFTRSAS
jgi:ATP-dependent helicase Lhr and Lhr-like helicase